MGSTERFIALLASIAAVLTLLGAVLRVLMRISWQTGRLVERFGEHVTDAMRIHGDQETRIRNLESRRRR